MNQNIIYTIYQKNNNTGEISYLACYFSKNLADKDMKELLNDRTKEDESIYKFALFISEVKKPVNMILNKILKWR